MPKAPILDAAGKTTKDVDLGADVFGAEVKPQLVHETVRAEAAAARAGTRAAKSRGMVAGGGAKPWRQKGTGRARAGTTRAPQWTGGGVAFPPRPRSFDLKVNRKIRKAAMRGALSNHVESGTFAVMESGSFGETPSTRNAVAFLAEWGKELPIVVVAQPDEDVLAKSFRNVDGVLVLDPTTLEVGAVVWARSLLMTESALARVKEIAQ
jgi:large subunit ribosomal protein L4